jgi:glyoxylase-like metal-dependent hydrolase (beta-lactamase superfamily II)
MEEVLKDIYLVPVPLPGSPLKILNSYIVKGPDRNLLIDVGYNTDEGETALKTAFDALGLRLEDTDVFLTHLHGDHTGLVSRLNKICRDFYISEYDGESVNNCWKEEHWREPMELQLRIGVPPEQELRYMEHPGFRGGATDHTDFKTASDGMTFDIGDYKLEVMDLRGHTPGLKGLYDREKKILFGSDHILEKITPNINAWDLKKDYLGLFIDNLKKVKDMDIDLILPGHRTSIRDHARRVDELIAHHDNRLTSIMGELRDGEKNAYQIAMGVRWEFGTSFFEDFPKEQKWFASNEVLAHLEHLRVLGKVDYRVDEGTYLYRSL